jgi:hypothetical protein
VAAVMGGQFARAFIPRVAPDCSVQVASDTVPRRNLMTYRHFLRTAWHGARAVGVKAATRRWRECARAGDGQPPVLVVGMRRQCRDQQRLM